MRAHRSGRSTTGNIRQVEPVEPLEQEAHMAKKKSRRKSTGRARKAVPAGPQCPADPAETYIVFRWYLTNLERILIEAYATCPTNCDKFLSALQTAVRTVYALGKCKEKFGGKSCPPGYEECDDGMCAPMCGWGEGEPMKSVTARSARA
jgi:hypothetical protein